MTSAQRPVRVAVVGAGVAGVCMAAALLDAGIRDVTIFEKGTEIGGTWRDNAYPGLTCDVPSRFYQFTFALNPEWSRFFSAGPEIRAYVQGVARDRGITDLVRFGTEVVDAQWRDGRWDVRTRSEGAELDEGSFDFLISGTGVLHHPVLPDISGVEDFDGPAFHSARWDKSVTTRGKRVGVIGSGSTGIQIMCGLVDEADLVMFQRTPQWVVPLPNFRYPALVRAAHRRVPGLSAASYRVYQRLFEQGTRAMTEPGLRRRLAGIACRAQLLRIRDRELRAKLTPDYEPLCKRLVISAGYAHAVQQPNVDVVTEGIDHIEPRGVVTVDGALHELDVLVFATGFDAHAYGRPWHLVGRDGLTLDEAWRDGPKAFNSVSLPGFPNYFMLAGPQSPIGNYSLTAVIEAQVEHAMRWIRRWRSGEFAAVEPTVRATEEFNRAVREAMPATIWVSGCDSWYLGESGLPELWPWPADHHRRVLADPHPEDYKLTA